MTTLRRRTRARRRTARLLCVWLPPLLAVGMLLLAHAARPTPAPDLHGAALSLPLPVPRADHAPRPDCSYELADDASRVTVLDEHGDQQGQPRALSGAIAFGADGQPAALELDLELAVVAATAAGVTASPGDRHLVFHCRPCRIDATPQPGLHATRWTSDVAIGDASQTTTLELWMVTIAAGRVHLQGTTRIAADVQRQRPAITVGLDLEFHLVGD